MKYREEKATSKNYKKNYLDGLESLIVQRQKDAEILRDEYFKQVFDNQEKYREDLKKMLGWPLTEYDAKELPECIMEKLSEEDGYCVYRVQFEILDGLKMTGLFFKSDEEKKPLVIVQHGGMGTPELISGVYGDTENYNDMLMRVRKHNVHVFAPQLLLWNEDGYELKHERNLLDSRLKRVGSSIAAVEIYGIMKILDYFQTQSYVSVFGMVGLSYGGFYTLYTSAIDTRIKSAISCSFFNRRDIIPWTDWTWLRSAEKFDDAEVACLVYPRRLCIEIGDNDELFDVKGGISSFEKLKKICDEVGTDWVEMIVFGGIHEFCKDDAPIERLITDLTKNY